MGIGSRCVFYSSFFHGHLFCDYRHIDHDKTAMFKFPEEPLNTMEMKSKALQFLNKYTIRNFFAPIIFASLNTTIP